MGGVFISYRRSDTAPYAGRLRDALRARFGPDQVFRDLDHIGPGERFESVIDSAVASCDVLLALVGPKWVGVRDGAKRRSRLHDPHDYVRRELAAGLRRHDVLFIPVLVAGAQMPSADQLPSDLATLPEHQGLGLTDERWDDDVARLIETVSARLEGDGTSDTVPSVALPRRAREMASRSSRPTSRRLVLAVGSAVAAIVATVTGMFLLPASGSSPDGRTEDPRDHVPTTSTTVTADTTTTTVARVTTTRGQPPADGSGSPKPSPTPPPIASPGPPPSTPTTNSTTTTTSTTTTPLPPETCKSGYVWRAARPSDLVCVTPATRDQTAADNSVKQSRWTTGEYGPHTCIWGYVWRDAFDGDDVCVLPATRDQAHYDNSQAAARRIGG